MNLFILDYIQGEGGGNIKNEIRTEYSQYENWFSENYRSHGNVLAHALYPIYNQACVKADTEAGTLEGRYCNYSFIRALVFCGSISNNWNKRYSICKNSNGKYEYRPEGASWQEMYQPLIYLYDKCDIDYLVKTKRAIYLEKAKDSLTHSYKNPEEFLGEYYILDRNDRPEPKFIIISKTGCKLQSQDRVDFDTYILPSLAKLYNHTNLIYCPEAVLKVVKTDDTTGNEKASKIGLKLLKALKKIHEGIMQPTCKV